MTDHAQLRAGGVYGWENSELLPLEGVRRRLNGVG